MINPPQFNLCQARSSLGAYLKIHFQPGQCHGLFDRDFPIDQGAHEDQALGRVHAQGESLDTVEVEAHKVLFDGEASLWGELGDGAHVVRGFDGHAVPTAEPVDDGLPLGQLSLHQILVLVAKE